MSQRLRKLLGAFAMIAFVVVYARFAMALAEARPLQEAPGVVRSIAYVVLGLAWIVPLMPLIRWMEGPGRGA